jgi:biopolymer transport protein ExbD
MPLDFSDVKPRSRELDVAPLIDVVFLLLIFFLLTSSYVFKTFELKMPAKAKVRPPDSDRLPPIAIMIQEDESVLFDGVQVDMRDLARNVNAYLPADGKRTFVIKPHDESEVETLIQVMERVRAAGATDVRLARRPGEVIGEGNRAD